MSKKLAGIEWNRYSIFIVLLVVIFVAALLNPNFLGPYNILNVLRQVAVITILAYGAMMLIIGRMIDLSAGSVMALAGVISVMAYQATGNLLIALVGVLGNIMNLTGVGSYIQQIVMGLIIVGAVAYDVFSKRGNLRTVILKPKREKSGDDGSGVSSSESTTAESTPSSGSHSSSGRPQS